MEKLTKAEQIAGLAEDVVARAQSLGVNIYILIQDGSQGGVYYYRNCDKRILTSLIKQSVRDLRTNEFEQDGRGNISYGL